MEKDKSEDRYFIIIRFNIKTNFYNILPKISWGS